MPFDLLNFCDAHIRELKYFTYGLGIVGAALVVKDLHLASTFRHVTKIPPKFFASRVTLQGQVEKVSGEGVIHISHRPVFTVPFSQWIHRLRSQEEESSVLLVELAGVKMTQPAADWLAANLEQQHVWFELLHPTKNTALCSVYKQKNFLFKTNVNETIVRQGLAPVLSESSAPNDVILALMESLRKSEVKARKKKLGIWKDPEPIESQSVSAPLWKTLFSWLGGKIKAPVRKKS